MGTETVDAAAADATDDSVAERDSSVVEPDSSVLESDSSVAEPVEADADRGADNPVAEPGSTIAELVEAVVDRGANVIQPPGELERRLEAILMVSDEPQSVVSLATALSAPVKQVTGAIQALVTDFDGVGGSIRRGFELREVGGGWRIYVRPEHDEAVADFVLTQNPTRLSQAALETLAVIAYKQPISRGAVASIRAVNVDSVVRTLLGRGLITEAYTDSETGAIHYETTDLMLVQLGINSIDELPQISPLLTDGSDGFDDVL